MTQSSHAQHAEDPGREPTAGASASNGAAAGSHPRPTSTGSSEETHTDRDLQRGALQELVALAAQCAATEVEIESRCEREIAAADQELIRADSALGAKYQQDVDDAKSAQRQRGGAVSAQSDFDTRALREADQQTRSRIAGEYEQAEQAVRQKLEQAVWLAESVFEATQIQVRADTAKAEEEYKKQLEELGQLDDKAYALLELYGQTATAAAGESEAADRDTLDDAEAEEVGPAAGLDLAPAAAGEARKQPTVVRAPPLSKAAEVFEARREELKQQLAQLTTLQAPRLFVGFRPYAIALLGVAVAVAVAQLVRGAPMRTGADVMNLKPAWPAIGYSVGGTVVGLLLLGVILRFVARAHVRGVYVPMQRTLAEARVAAKARYQYLARTQDSKYAHALKKRDAEVRAAKDQASPQQTRALRTRDQAAQVASSERERQLTRITAQRDGALSDIERELAAKLTQLKQDYERDAAAAQEWHSKRTAHAQETLASERIALEARWHEGLRKIQAPIRATEGEAPHDWTDPAWRSWKPASRFATTIPFGKMAVDLKQVTRSVARDTPSRLELPSTFSLPALLAFPKQSSLIVQADRHGRDEALRVLQMVMVRLLTNLPPGRVRFTIFDPVGLGQNFAGFMHLADHDENLVGGRIWTSQEQFDQRLGDLTEHMETVIQKYLRNEFETIDDYNAQAGELAEPYRFLVIADFPIGFSQDSVQKLNSIASTGAKCGVYTLIARDLRASMPVGSHIDEVVRHSINLEHSAEGRFVWKDEVFEQFPLSIDPPPPEESLTQILNVVGHHAKDANRVEVPFEGIAPRADQIWTGDCTDELRVPIGRMGATRSQLLRLGKGVAQHALIAGKTGSGKSTLLHVLVTNLALWYHPDEVEFYLVDFKKGVEFKTYATHTLPHARAIAVESDREFGLSVLQRLDAELSRRGEMYRKLGVQDLSAYREASGKKIPRTLLMIDEFQEFFSEDDKLAQDAALLLDRLVRQGRAFGVHVLLGSQTIGGSSGLARSTIGQMAVRIALQTSEADSQLILGDSNSAARLLSRPGEAIYNDQGGLVEGNSPFQISWLPDEQRDGYLDGVQERVRKQNVAFDPPVVFEGNAPADVARNMSLAQTLAGPDWSRRPGPPTAWLGEPVAIKEATGIAFRRQSGANALVVGQQDEAALAIMCSSIISLASQQAPDAASFYVLDGTPADSPFAGTFARVRDAIPHSLTLVEWRSIEETIHALADEVERRQGSGAAQDGGASLPAIYVLVHGLQRFRVLRKSDESGGFSFSLSNDDDEGKPKRAAVDRRFADLLREGPALGVHVLTWADTPASVDRTLDRASMREFDHRVLFQMSANDSSNLIDSPAANKLGFHRALAYSEEQGVMEKFRPYALPGKTWLEHVRACLLNKKP